MRYTELHTFRPKSSLVPTFIFPETSCKFYVYGGICLWVVTNKLFFFFMRRSVKKPRLEYSRENARQKEQDPLWIILFINTEMRKSGRLNFSAIAIFKMLPVIYRGIIYRNKTRNRNCTS